MTLRNRNLLDLCHSVNACQLGIPEVCIGYSPDGCEPAHGPKSMFNGGGALKSDDIPCASCGPCHRELDQGRRLTREEKHWYWMRGAIRTMTLFMERGWLKLAAKAREMA